MSIIKILIDKIIVIFHEIINSLLSVKKTISRIIELFIETFIYPSIFLAIILLFHFIFPNHDINMFLYLIIFIVIVLSIIFITKVYLLICNNLEKEIYFKIIFFFISIFIAVYLTHQTNIIIYNTTGYSGSNFIISTLVISILIAILYICSFILISAILLFIVIALYITIYSHIIYPFLNKKTCSLIFTAILITSVFGSIFLISHKILSEPYILKETIVYLDFDNSDDFKNCKLQKYEKGAIVENNKVLKYDLLKREFEEAINCNLPKK
jgi:hypothetical protein